jgi:hypothetical protein
MERKELESPDNGDGEVVVRSSFADETIDLGNNPIADLLRWEINESGHKIQEVLLSKEHSLFVSSLRQAVGIDKKNVSGLKFDPLLNKRRAW